MPDMNGIECVRRIRKSIGKQVPVIVLTAYDWTDIQEEAEDAGVSAFCSKPLFFSELKETLETICEDEPKKHLQNLEDIISFPDYHILLVEDVELNCEIAEEILKEAGLRVTSAANGQEAVEVISQAAEDEFDLILMDIQMPVMDGYEACRRIRKLENKKKAGIPILAMTADAFEEDRIRALQAGMDGHLSKPISREVLYRELNRHLKVNEKPEPGKNEGSICHARNTDRETCSKMQEI
jgi:CheY-like chemotaxis protein